MGGTWMQNRYPGAAVDVYSTLYSLSFEPYPWTRLFAHQKELEAYTDHIIDNQGLRGLTDTKTNVQSVHWQEEYHYWEVKTSQQNYRSRFIINATGLLSAPVIPQLSGTGFLSRSIFSHKSVGPSLRLYR